MKHLLTGVAMAAALAIAAPAWAQAPMTPGGNNPTSGSAGPFAPKPPAAAPAAAAPAAAAPAMGARGGKSVKARMHRAVHHHRMMHSGDAMTEQLNAQELQRITSGAPPAPMAPMGGPGGNNPTSGASGPFYPGGTAPPPPPR